MAKKKVENKEVENVDIDALVNEGKNVDTVKVAEIIADNEEDNKDTEEVEAEDLVQEAKDAQADEIIKGIMEETDEVSGEEVEDEEHDWKPEKNDEEFEEDSNIDDVIAECTGKADEKVQAKKENVKEPWYVSRAKRIGDYYNW